MKFRVTRVSTRGKDPLCPGAVLEDGRWWLEVATIPALLKVAEEHCRFHQVIVELGKDGVWDLVIYDAYQE